jgi:chaperonin GroEL
MVQAGIIDPLRVVDTGLEKATSVAGLMLTSAVLIVSQPEPPKPAAPPGGGMGGMGGMGMGDDHDHFDM